MLVAELDRETRLHLRDSPRSTTSSTRPSSETWLLTQPIADKA